MSFSVPFEFDKNANSIMTEPVKTILHNWGLRFCAVASVAALFYCPKCFTPLCLRLKKKKSITIL